MSTRWPLRSTRGFSATPRSSWKKKITGPAARAIVKRAGPLENAFITNSTLIDTTGLRPSTYASSGVRQDLETFVLMQSTDWNQNTTSTRERVKVKRFDCNIHCSLTASTTNFPIMAWCGVALVAGTFDDIDDDLKALFAVPWGLQSNLTALEDLPRGVRYLKRAEFFLKGPGATASVSATERMLTNIAFGQQTYKRLRLTARNFWLREPEQVALLFYSLKDSYTSEATAGFGGISGFHTTLVRLSHY